MGDPRALVAQWRMRKMKRTARVSAWVRRSRPAPAIGTDDGRSPLLPGESRGVPMIRVAPTEPRH